MEKRKVFVYGTLRQGQSNHRLIDGSKYLGTCGITGPHVLHDMGFCPALVPVDNEVNTVFGEVYEVTLETLYRLDTLEGHPEWYYRELIDTELGRAYVYYMPEALISYIEPIHSGDWVLQEEEYV